MIAQRDSSIDILRFVGMAFIILAHVLPSSSPLFQFRTFDVSIMIFVSGLAYAGRKMEPYPQFVWKRLQRLLVPVYIFLIAYFLVNATFTFAGLAELPPSDTIIGTFLLIDPNIGYVWVIRIFLIIMLITPLLMRIESGVKNNILFGVLVAAWLVGQYYLVSWLLPLKPGVFVNDYVLYTTGYGVLFLLGLRMKDASTKTLLLFALCMLAAMVILGLGIAEEKGTWLRMQWFKYPPQTYYLVWGALISLALWSCRKWWSRWLDFKWVNFIGQNTIWIYLWHIPFVSPVNEYIPTTYWWLRYVIVCGCAVGVYTIQYHIVQRMAASRPDKKNRFLKYFKG